MIGLIPDEGGGFSSRQGVSVDVVVVQSQVVVEKKVVLVVDEVDEKTEVVERQVPGVVVAGTVVEAGYVSVQEYLSQYDIFSL